MDQTNPRTHLVKDATLADELLSGLGVDSDRKANMWDKQLQKEHQSKDQSNQKQKNQSLGELESYLIHRMHSGELPVHGNSKHLCHQMRLE